MLLAVLYQITAFRGDCPRRANRKSPFGEDDVGSGGSVFGRYAGEHGFDALIVVFDPEFLRALALFAFVRGKLRLVLRGKLLPLALVLGLAADIQNARYIIFIFVSPLCLSPKVFRKLWKNGQTLNPEYSEHSRSRLRWGEASRRAAALADEPAMRFHISWRLHFASPRKFRPFFMSLTPRRNAQTPVLQGIRLAPPTPTWSSSILNFDEGDTFVKIRFYAYGGEK